MSQVNRPEVIAFLNAIKEEPDDNSLRLILADYLEERDDPRGTFLRCETEIASMDRFDDRIWDFKKQRDELWSLHRNEWLGSFASYVNHATLRDDEQSSRGLLAVEMSKQRLLDPTTLSLANSEIWSWVDELRTKLNRNNILGLDDLGLLSHLATLDLSGSMLRRVGASALAKTSFLSNVRRLILADCELTTAGLDSLLASRRLTELATLDLSQNELRPPSFEVLSQADLQLDELILQDNQLNFAGMSELVKASWMEGLRSLDLSRNYLSGDTLTPIVACEALADLTKLKISDCRRDEPVVHQLAHATFASQLSELNLSDCGINSIVMQTLDSVEWPNLTTLDLTDNIIETYEIEGLTKNENLFGRVERLSLNAPRYVAAWEVLMQCPFLSQLRSLTLRRVSFRIGIDDLFCCRYLENLEELCLVQAFGLRDSGGERLRDSSLRSLRRLSIPDDPVQDVWARELAESPALKNLREIELRTSHLMPETQAMLEERFDRVIDRHW